MANNDFDSWMDERVLVFNHQNSSYSVLFRDLYPILLEKPDVMEAADWYPCSTASDFVSKYMSNHFSLGYGEFKVDL